MDRIRERLRRRPWILLELALAALVISWRAAAPTWHPLGLDLLFYLGLYWVFDALVPEGRAWEGATLLVMMGCLAIYLKGQMPHILSAVNLLP